MSALGSLVDQAVSATTRPSAAVDGEARYQSTRVIASFHTDNGFDGAVDSTGGVAATGDAGGSVSRFLAEAAGAMRTGPAQPMRIFGLKWSKHFGDQPGTWSLTVKGRDGINVQRLWRDPEDVWVRIVVVKNGEPREVAFGLMNTVSEGMMRGGQGERNVTYTLQGLDFHKVFHSTQLYINIFENGGQLPIIPLYRAVSEKLIGTPDSTLKAIIDAWLGNNGVADKQWKLPKSLGGGYFFDMLQLDFQKCRGRIYDPALYSADQFMGKSLWQSLQEYSNGLLNEMYTTTFEDAPFKPDVRPRPQLVLRERPFPTKDGGDRSWNALPTHELRPGDIKGRQMTRGAPESRFNYWTLDAKGLVGDGLSVQLQINQTAQREGGVPGGAPIYSTEDIRKHGFRRFLQSTRYLPFREDINWFQHSASWLKILHDWYAVTPYELAGTMQCSEVFPAIRIGHRIKEVRSSGEEMIAYVEGVSHDWQFPGPGLTTLNLTRGEFSDEHLLDIAYEQYLSSESAIERATGLTLNSPLGDAVPTGSGPRLDRMVGQVDTPERVFLAKRGKTYNDQDRIRRGEPSNPNPAQSRTVRPADLPDQQVPEDAEIAVGNAKPRERKQGGNLTQRELESGKPLPVREREVTTRDKSSESTDQARRRWQKTSGKNRGGRR